MIIKHIQLYFRRKMQAWLSVRLPAVRRMTLDHRSIFIFPTKAGLVFLGLIVLLLISAINYQNSMLYAFSFLLGSMYAVSMIHCYRNLSGLTLGFNTSVDCFPGQHAEFEFYLQREQQSRRSDSLILGWPQGNHGVIAVNGNSTEMLRITYPAQTRGWLRPGRLLLETFYPFGLTRAWTWLDLSATALVYPQPQSSATLPSKHSGTDDGQARRIIGQDDYYGLRDFVPGDPLKHVAWKQFARRDQLLTKEFASVEGESDWLDLKDYPGVPLETVLSYLCERVLRLSESRKLFGLRLADREIVPGTGDNHRRACLRELAVFGISSANSFNHQKSS